MDPKSSMFPPLHTVFRMYMVLCRHLPRCSHRLWKTLSLTSSRQKFLAPCGVLGLSFASYALCLHCSVLLLTLFTLVPSPLPSLRITACGNTVYGRTGKELGRLESLVPLTSCFWSLWKMRRLLMKPNLGIRLRYYVAILLSCLVSRRRLNSMVLLVLLSPSIISVADGR